MLSLNLINWRKVFQNMNINICSLNFEKKHLWQVALLRQAVIFFFLSLKFIEQLNACHKTIDILFCVLALVYHTDLCHKCINASDVD